MTINWQDPFYFRIGKTLRNDEPLGRFLPRYSPRCIRSWLKQNIPSRSWVLDPFGTSPLLPVEAASAGYRVLVTANNPISRFLIEIYADPPREEELNAVLAKLSATRWTNERMEPHIRNLYLSRCNHCKELVEVKAFLWDKEKESIFAKIFHCMACDVSGEFPVSQEDVEKALEFSQNPIQRTRALSRIAGVNDPQRPFVIEALQVYPDRSVYALFTLINEMDAMNLTTRERQILSALLLYACDMGNGLWRYPNEIERPLQLTLSNKYRENNIWLALEKAVNLWQLGNPSTSLVEWPDSPPESGGICLYEGKLSQLMETMEDAHKFKTVVGIFPRPNQAFWTLSALWAGWLWGRESVGPFINVLKRRRYDWSWHTTALENNLESLASHLEPDTPFFGLITRYEPGFEAAIQVSAGRTGWRLKGFASRLSSEQSQFLFRLEKSPNQKTSGKSMESLIRDTARDVLLQIGQPVHGNNLYLPEFKGLSDFGYFSMGIENAHKQYTDSRDLMENALTYQHGFLQYKNEFIWLQDYQGKAPSLADRVEKFVVNLIISSPRSTTRKIHQEVCKQFPALQTPPKEMVEAVLRSYGASKRGRWVLREKDDPNIRREHLRDIHKVLFDVGTGLGYRCIGEKPLLWLDPSGNSEYIFYIIVSAIISDMVISPEYPPEKCYIVLPGGKRTDLVAYKLQNDPFLQYSVEKGWKFIKFHQIRTLTQFDNITKEFFDSQTASEPLNLSVPQLRLL
ncbi:MAG: hypothetical protein JXA19_06805 [Anaerolineales bacterium]|nr:hypothetical protein [Anaerolineales bacterium]